MVIKAVTMIGMLRQRIIRLKTIFTRIVKEYVSFGGFRFGNNRSFKARTTSLRKIN